MNATPVSQHDEGNGTVPSHFRLRDITGATAAWFMLVMFTAVTCVLNFHGAKLEGTTHSGYLAAHAVIPFGVLVVALFAELLALMPTVDRYTKTGGVVLLLVVFAAVLVMSYSGILTWMEFAFVSDQVWVEKTRYVLAAAPDAVMIVAAGSLLSRRLNRARAEGASDESNVLGDLGGVLVRRLNAKERAAEAEAELERARLAADERAAERAAQLERERLAAEVERARLAAEAETERARIAAEQQEHERTHLAREHAPDARDAHEHPARPERAEGDDPYARAKNLDTYAPPAHLRALAEELIARGRTRVSDAHAVAVALMLNDEGKPRAAIEHETGIQRDAIRRLIDSAAKLSEELDQNGGESAA